jgi:hypothetical protein
MGRKNSRTLVKGSDCALLGKRISAVALGVAFLLMPLLLGGGSAVLHSIAQGLRIPALVAVAIGTVLIALYVLLRPNQSIKAALKRARNPTAQTAVWTAQAQTRDVRHQFHVHG